MRRVLRRKATTAVAAALLAMLLIPSCSDDTADPAESTPPISGIDSSRAPTTGSTSGSEPPAGPTSTPTTTQPAEPTTIRMVMTGDVLLHEGLWATAERDADRTGRGAMDFRPILADMRPVISGADYAICHMETPLAPLGGPYSGYPSFSVPPQILPALEWAGYDACSTASNHSIDQGFDGLERTIDDFDGSGVAHFGTAKTEQASKHALLVDVKGVRVGLISATYGTNGIPLPESEPWSVPIINAAKILRMAHEARVDGAEIVIVALHWGLEYQNEPISEQTELADTLTRSPDISFVYGHHAHVVQPYDKVNGTWVVYGLGNAIAQQETDVTGVYDGNTCRVTFTQKADGTFDVSALEYIPTMITKYDYTDPTAHPMRWLDVPKDLTDPAYRALRPDLLATQARVRANVDLLGALSHGVTEGS